MIYSYPVLRLDIKQKWRDHADGLLTTDVANLGFCDQERMELCILDALFQKSAGNIKVPAKLVGVPSKGAGRISNDSIDRDVAQVRHKGILDRVADLSSVAVGKIEKQLEYSSISA